LTVQERQIMPKIGYFFEKLKEPKPYDSVFTIPKYVVGANQLLVFFDGLLCVIGEENQYIELGEPNTESEKIQFKFKMKEKDEVSVFVYNFN
jgi:hypothetical protein